MFYSNTDYREYPELFARIQKAQKLLYSGAVNESLAPGRYEFEDGIYYMIGEYETIDPEGIELEGHKNYLDIQFMIKGEERLAIAPADTCKKITKEFDDEADIWNGKFEAYDYIDLKPGYTLVLMPEDAHRPQITPADGVKRQVKKCVVKVPVK